MEEWRSWNRGEGTGGGVNRRRLGEVWWNNNLSVFVSVCVSGEVCFVSVYLGFVFCNSCAFL